MPLYVENMLVAAVSAILISLRLSVYQWCHKVDVVDLSQSVRRAFMQSNKIA